ncbi:MAG: PEP-CTERM sorting domain-containing protein [Planctomycetes bacterium]|nr:PEP-CTERM sorting domain-containing protein [Planctomycetota bacterium]
MKSRVCKAMVALALLCQVTHAQFVTLIDNGPSSNRVDMVFLGDGYTQSDLDAGTYAAQVTGYLDYMFDSSGVLADPFPRYQNFFNAYAIEVVSNESGADKPSQNVFVDTALDATYETNDIDRLLSVDSVKASDQLNAGLAGTGVTADMQFITVNDTKYGGSGGTWATFAGGNSSAREIALHEVGHSFSSLADEYVTFSEPYVGLEPLQVNVTTDPAGAKWSPWLGFDDPRGSNLDIGVYEGAHKYETDIYRPSLNSKMRSLNRAFDAVSREKFILDIYDDVDPVDDWLENLLPVEDSELWVNVVDANVILVEWLVDGELVVGATGETFDATDFGFGPGTYSVVARAYDEVLDHTFEGSLLDLVRRDYSQLEQEISWSLIVTIAGDFSGNGFVEGKDLALWQTGFGQQSGAVTLDGDADEDADVDGFDYLAWQRNYAPESATIVAVVPEPATFFLLILGLPTMCLTPSRRRRQQQFCSRRLQLGIQRLL